MKNLDWVRKLVVDFINGLSDEDAIIVSDFFVERIISNDLDEVLEKFSLDANNTCCLDCIKAHSGVKPCKGVADPDIDICRDICGQFNFDKWCMEEAVR